MKKIILVCVLCTLFLTGCDNLKDYTLDNDIIDEILSQNEQYSIDYSDIDITGYSFTREDDKASELEYTSKILNVYDYMNQNNYGLFVGQVATAFGSDGFTNDNENLFTYPIEVKDADGNTCILDLYFGPSGPAIGGDVSNPDHIVAAEALAAYISNIVPDDFECESVYTDFEATVIMGTKDGVGFYKTK